MYADFTEKAPLVFFTQISLTSLGLRRIGILKNSLDWLWSNKSWRRLIFQQWSSMLIRFDIIIRMWSTASLFGLGLNSTNPKVHPYDSSRAISDHEAGSSSRWNHLCRKVAVSLGSWRLFWVISQMRYLPPHWFWLWDKLFY